MADVEMEATAEAALGPRTRVMLSTPLVGQMSRVPYDVPVQINSIDEVYIARDIAYGKQLPECMVDSVISTVRTFRLKEAQNEHDEEESRDMLRRFGDDATAPLSAEVRASVDAWASHFSKEHAAYRQQLKTPEAQRFANVFHESIHSPAQMTILQLEHTYGVNMAELVERRDQELGEIAAIQEREVAASMGKQGSGSMSDEQVRRLQARHSRVFDSKKQALDDEIASSKETQRRDFHEYVEQLFFAEQSAPVESPARRYRPMSDADSRRNNAEANSGSRAASGMLRKAASLLRGRGSAGTPDSGSTSPYRTQIMTSPLPTLSLEESFTVHLGTQRKTSHNLRLVAADSLHLMFRDPAAEFEDTQAERLMTSMALYSTKSLRAMLRLVDTKLSNFTGRDLEFAKICEKSTDFHFPAFDAQLRNVERKVSMMAPSRDLHDAADDEHMNGESQDFSSNESRLECGDYYVTKHSNLASYHVVFHLAAGNEANKSDLNTRSPIIAGVRSILRVAFQYGITHVAMPLLLVEDLNEDMTPKWQLRRAELVLKCVKGFVLEHSVGGTDESKTIQFLVPPDTSVELFDAFCEMVANTFRLSGTKNFNS